MFSFLFKKAKSAPQSLTDICPIEPLTLSVLPDLEGIAFLKIQLELDINAKGLGWRPVQFELFELLEMETLLKRKLQVGRASVAYTHPECAQLARYAGHYYVQARDIEDFERATAYNRLVFSLLDPSNLIKISI